MMMNRLQRNDEPHRPYGLSLHAGAYLEGDLMLNSWVGVLETRPRLLVQPRF